MADEKKKLPRITSSRLTFKFPKLDAPDFGNEKFPKPDGEYSTIGIGRADDADVKAMIAKLEPLHKEAVKVAAAEFKKLKPETRKKLGSVKVNSFYTECLDKETEEPTGDVEFRFAMKASGEYKKGPKQGQKWTRKPAIFDAKGTPMKKVPPIWGGTVGKINFEVSPYFIPGTAACGIKLALQAVQIIDLVSQGQRSAKDYGFGEEDGYAQPDEGFDDETENKSEDKSDAPGAKAAGDDDDDDDF